jgi:hypothetical protein
MWHKQWMASAGLLALAAMAGCGKSGGTSTEAVPAAIGTHQETIAPTDNKNTSAAVPNDPAGVVACFLEAIRKGNDDKANSLLSATAKQKTAERNCRIMPPASDTAKFQVGKVEYVGEDGTVSPAMSEKCTGARVAADWTDRTEDGTTQTDHALWVVRREPEGWRVCGLAALVFPGEPPLLLDFENPKEMMDKLQWLQEEMNRRSQQENPEAQAGKNSKDSIRR